MQTVSCSELPVRILLFNLTGRRESQNFLPFLMVGCALVSFPDTHAPALEIQ